LVFFVWAEQPDIRLVLFFSQLQLAIKEQQE